VKVYVIQESDSTFGPEEPEVYITATDAAVAWDALLDALCRVAYDVEDDVHREAYLKAMNPTGHGWGSHTVDIDKTTTLRSWTIEVPGIAVVRERVGSAKAGTLCRCVADLPGGAMCLCHAPVVVPWAPGVPMLAPNGMCYECEQGVHKSS
jgi:hypothetical protein